LLFLGNRDANGSKGNDFIAYRCPHGFSFHFALCSSKKPGSGLSDLFCIYQTRRV
jgi:hypothetical protein